MDCKDVDKVFKKLVVDSKKHPKSRLNTFLQAEGCKGGRRSQYRGITVARRSGVGGQSLVPKWWISFVDAFLGGYL